MSKKHLRMLHLATVASSNSNGKFKLGAVIANKKVVSVGYNFNRNDPSVSHTNSLCAEESAIFSAPCIVGSTVYVARVNRHGVWRNARPCNDCIDLMVSRGVKQVIFTVSDNEYAVLRLQ